jgi:Sec7-like guanine-nucleotide exchange factor
VVVGKAREISRGMMTTGLCCSCQIKTFRAEYCVNMMLIEMVFEALSLLELIIDHKQLIDVVLHLSCYRSN